MKINKILSYLEIFLILLCFFILYNKINIDVGKYVLILMLLPVCLLFRRINLLFSIAFVSASVYVSFFTFGFNYKTLIISSVFLILLPVLFLFSTRSALKFTGLKKKNDELKFYKEELLNEEKSLIAKRQALEKKLERITHFFLISKDLTKNIDAQENTANALQNVLSSRQGICYCVITKNIKYKQDSARLKILSVLDKYKKEKWDKLLKNNNELDSLNKPALVKSLFDIEKKPVVAWPIIIDGELDSCTFLVVEPEFSQTYLEEGELFIPHLKLGTKRINLFYELKEKSRIDGLTGLYLKRYFIEKMHSEIERVKRYKTDFYIMMSDIDFFKKINDTYGHLTGDKVLKETAKIILNSVRPGDIVGRYGGEEFIVLLPTISEQKVLDIAENIRETIKNTVFEEKNHKFNITISIGICKYVKDTKFNTLISNVDKALYDAKHSGRNKVIIYKEKN